MKLINDYGQVIYTVYPHHKYTEPVVIRLLKEFYRLLEVESMLEMQYYEDALGRTWCEDYEGLMLVGK